MVADMTPAEVDRAIHQALRGERSHYVSKDVYDVKIAALGEDLKEVKDSQKWLMRLMVAQFFMLIVTLVVYAATQGVPG